MKDRDLLEYLYQLGLTKYEAVAYFTLLKHGGLKASEIVKRSGEGVPKGRIYNVLHTLQKKRFIKVERQESRRKTVQIFHPISPSFALANSIVQRENFLNTLRNDIMPIYETMYETGAKSPIMERMDMVWVIKGESDTYNTIFDYFDTATEKIYFATMTKQSVKGAEMGIIHNLMDANMRGVKIFHIANMDEEYFKLKLKGFVLPIAKMITLENYQLKFNPHIHTSCFIIDDRISIIWLADPDTEEALGSIFLENRLFASYLGKWFERFWKSGYNVDGRAVFQLLFGQTPEGFLEEKSGETR